MLPVPMLMVSGDSYRWAQESMYIRGRMHIAIIIPIAIIVMTVSLSFFDAMSIP